MFNNFFSFSALRKIYRTVFFLVLFFASHHARAQSENISLDRSSWLVLAYNKIPANKVDFIRNSLSIQVAKSAGPIVYKLKNTEKISGFVVKGTFKGKKELELNEFDEDSILRFGLVATGRQTLSGIKRFLAADWVKKLFALASDGTGLDKIYFYNITNRKELLGKSRSHPKSELIYESAFLLLDKEGPFEMAVNLPQPIEIAAIWISVDGDDTQSEFVTMISDIAIKKASN